MIHITDSQTDRILDFIQEEEFWQDNHHKSLKDTLETFDFVTFADREFSEHLTKMNRVIIPDEDGKFIEFIIQNTMKYRGQQGGLFVEVYTSASYIELKKSKVIKPQKLEGYTAAQHADFAIAGTEWEVGRVDYAGVRTVAIESHTNPFAYLKRIASEFGLELRFRVEVDGNKVTHRYVDLIDHVGNWQGREVEFGKDLLGIERKEDTSKIVTALIGLGPEREDGTRLEVLVEDKEALARWGRNGQRIIDIYEPQSDDQNMTEERLRELTKNELEKRINSIVEYTADIADLEKVPGLEHEKIRFGDVIRIKDTDFNPPLYLEARVHTQERSIKKNGYKTVTLGDYIEYTEEEIQAAVKALQAEIRNRIREYAEPKKVASPTPPQIDGSTNPIWVDTSKEPHVAHVADVENDRWVKITPTDAGEVNAYNKTEVDNIKTGLEQGIQSAMQTADGKNTVFRQSEQPPTTGRKNGDLWFKTDAGNKMYVFAGSDWVETKLDAEALAVGKLSAISADLGNITAGHIQGVTLDLANGKFVVDVEGNVKFAGTLDGASGTFGEVTVKDGDFYLEDNQSLTKYSVVTKQNFIIDHSFESIQADDPQSQDDINKNWSNAIIPSIGSPWVAVGTPRCVPNGFHGPPPYDARPIFGDRSIAVNKDNYVYQDIYKISPGTNYTISVFAKRVYNMPAGSAQIVVQHIRPLPNGTETVVSEKSSSTMVVRGDYEPVRMATTYLYGNFQDGDFLRIMFKSTNSNWVMVDGVQFVEGNYPTVYNSEDSFHDFMHGRIRWGHFVGENTILAYGESDNGHFVRFGNGFQICWINKTVTVTISAPYGSLFLGYYQWTFPATFISPPTVSCGYFKWGTGASWGTINEVSTTNASLRGIDSFERNAGSTRISAVAMGWWK